MLENVEDLNLSAAGVERDWIADFSEDEPALFAVAPLSAGLTLAAGQSPDGVLQYTATPNFGFISKSFGVPVPSAKGMSTLTHPGNIASFETLAFVACAQPTANDLTFQVILECYPQNNDSTFPKLYWNYSAPIGATFGMVELDLRSPSHSEDTAGASLEDLLSATRFLSFYMYAGPLGTEDPIEYYLDDIRFLGIATFAPAWELYQ